MDISSPTNADAIRWFIRKLADDDLCSGRVPGIDVTQSKLQRHACLGIARSPDCILDSLTAHSYPTLVDYLDATPHAIDALAEVGRLILDGATDGGIAPSLADGIRSLNAPFLSMILSHRTRINHSLPLHYVTKFYSAGLTPEQVYFVHPSATAYYRIQIDAHVRPESNPTARLRTSIFVGVEIDPPKQPILTRMIIQ